jgi:hypothetical protein
MKTYSRHGFESTLWWSFLLFWIALAIMYPGGWIVCKTLVLLFDSLLTRVILEDYYWCVGFLITGITFAVLKDRIIIREKNPLFLVFLVNEFFNPEHWDIYPAGQTHVVNPLKIRASPMMSIAKIIHTTPEDKPLSIPVTDDELRVWVTFAITPLDPRFMFLRNAEGAAFEHAIAGIVGIMEKHCSSLDSAAVLGQNIAITSILNAEINLVNDIRNNGFSVNVQVKNIDNSIRVKNAKAQTLRAELFARSVNKLADPANGLDKKTSGAMLLAQEGRGEFKDSTERKENIFRFEGSPEAMEFARRSGIMFGAGHEDAENTEA